MSEKNSSDFDVFMEYFTFTIVKMTIFGMKVVKTFNVYNKMKSFVKRNNYDPLVVKNN